MIYDNGIGQAFKFIGFFSLVHTKKQDISSIRALIQERDKKK